MLTLAISFLTTFNLPWFVDLTFQVLVQYCSLQHQALLLSLVTSTTGCCFCFGSVSSFFLELFLHWSPVAYWALPTWEVHLSVSCLLPFHTLHGVLKARTLKWFALPFSRGSHFVHFALAAIIAIKAQGFPGDSVVKNLPAMQEIWVQALGWENPLEDGMQLTLVLLPGEFHGQRSLVGYSPWSCKEPDTTEVTKQQPPFRTLSLVTDVQNFIHINEFCLLLKSQR